MYCLICVGELLLLSSHTFKDSCFYMPVLMHLMQGDGTYSLNSHDGQNVIHKCSLLNLGSFYWIFAKLCHDVYGHNVMQCFNGLNLVRSQPLCLIWYYDPFAVNFLPNLHCPFFYLTVFIWSSYIQTQCLGQVWWLTRSPVHYGIVVLETGGGEATSTWHVYSFLIFMITIANSCLCGWHLSGFRACYSNLVIFSVGWRGIPCHLHSVLYCISTYSGQKL